MWRDWYIYLRKDREDECCLTRIWGGPSPCARWQSAWARAACPAAASCNCGPPPDWKNILQCRKIFCGEKNILPNGKIYPNAWKYLPTCQMWVCAAPSWSGWGRTWWESWRGHCSEGWLIVNDDNYVSFDEYYFYLGENKMIKYFSFENILWNVETYFRICWILRGNRRPRIDEIEWNRRGKKPRFDILFYINGDSLYLLLTMVGMITVKLALMDFLNLVEAESMSL